MSQSNLAETEIIGPTHDILSITRNYQYHLKLRGRRQDGNRNSQVV